MSATSSDRTPALADPSTICGAPSPSVRELEASQAAREAFINGNAGNERFGPTKIVIPVHFVCVHDDATGMLDRSVFQSQFEVLNERFARSVNGGLSVAFEHNGVSYVNDAHLFRSLQYHTDPSLEDWARQATEKAGLTATPDRLRFFTCQCDDGLLGWANIPLGVSGSGRQVGSYGDAAFMSYNTLPGAPGAREPFHLGITGLHEVGHWLGLFHTFQGGCLGGDKVHDTPAHQYSKAWCHGKPDPKDRNGACRAEERAPVKNYMNYTDDDWMDNFTPQQLERVRDVAQWLRPGTVANVSERVSVTDLCGARDLTIEEMRRYNADRLERVQAMKRLSSAKLSFPVHFLCVHDGADGKLDQAAFDNQLAVLNRVFQRHNNESLSIEFTSGSFTQINDGEAFRGLQHSGADNIGALAQRVTEKAGLTAKPGELRFFSIQCDGGLLGWANIPSGIFDEGAKPGSWQDAAFMSYKTLPGTSVAEPPFDLGITGVHEIGHWLGLWHTFQGGCDGIDDEVRDTVSHAYPNFGCPDPDLRNGACRTGESAPVKNYMNYTDDIWMDRFSPGQLDRIRDVARVYRPGAVSN